MNDQEQMGMFPQDIKMGELEERIEALEGEVVALLALIGNKKVKAVEQMKLNTDYKMFLDKLNQILKSKFMGDDKSERQFKKLVQRGYQIKQIVGATYAASKDPHLMGENDMQRKYLSPEFITRSDKFTFWLQEFDSKYADKLLKE